MLPALLATLGNDTLSTTESFRPPAIPLVVHDPYFSIWSTSDALNDGWPTHWTGRIHAMQMMIRIDGRAWRLMGPAPGFVPPLKQTKSTITATRSTFTFSHTNAEIQLEFTTPKLAQDLKVFSRPVTYLTWSIKWKDRRKHEADLYFDITGEFVTDNPDQPVQWSSGKKDGVSWLRMGTQSQKVLNRSGDDTRIDWGFGYLATKSSSSVHSSVVPADEARSQFYKGEQPKAPSDFKSPRPASDRWPGLSMVITGADKVKSPLMIGYDSMKPIQYIGKDLLPYWRKFSPNFEQLLVESNRDFESIYKQCTTFDSKFAKDASSLGGSNYADICNLAYRQCFAGHTIAQSPTGEPWYFSKECFSNGCISTVDVTYPSAPQLLAFNPTLLKGLMDPVMLYAESARWRFNFAPHDLGQYPLANGQVYGDGERGENNQMPVEESGNLLILAAAIARAEGNPNYAKQHWTVLTKWANFLKEKGLDPENQLCTDDFAGHLAHNANLSIKAIVALAAYADLAQQLHDPQAGNFRELSRDYAKRWLTMAQDGDHTRLAFDRPNTWSQKYNLVWDSVLGYNLFDPSLAKSEMTYYKKVQNQYGLPLDNRKDYTKTDWTLWSACLTNNRSDFDALVLPVWRSLSASRSRVPMTDWYDTKSAAQVGFQARTVVGGVFMRFLTNPKVWNSYARP